MELSERALGAFSLSAGTSGAIAALVEAEGNPRRRQETSQYDALYININTLARNAHASLNSATQVTISPEVVGGYVLDDIQHLCGVLNQVELPLVIYHTGESDFRKKYPIGNPRLPSTDKQLFAKDFNDSLISKVMSELVKVDPDLRPKLKVQVVNKLMIDSPSKHKNPIYLTSNYLDLLEVDAHNLLQSYTGNIIPKHDFWKLYNKSAKLKDRDFSRIPFNRLFIQIFGDSKTFYARGYKELERILDLSEKRDWNQTTTRDRIRMTMKQDGLWKEEYDEVKF